MTIVTRMALIFSNLRGMRHFLALLLDLDRGPSLLHAQTTLGCDPDVLLAVDDTYVIHEANSPRSEQAYWTTTSSMWTSSAFLLRSPRASPMKRARASSSTQEDPMDGNSCCGTFTFTYSLQSLQQRLHRRSHHHRGMRRAQKATAPPSSWSPPSIPGRWRRRRNGRGHHGHGLRLHVCENSITTIIAPHSDQNTYDWTVTGGSLSSASQESTAEVEWGAAGQGNVSVIITGPGGTEVMQQCVEIGAAPVADFTAPSPVCLLTPVQFQSTRPPARTTFGISAMAPPRTRSTRPTPSPPRSA